MAKRVRSSKVRRVALSDAKDDLSRYLRLAETEEIVSDKDADGEA